MSDEQPPKPAGPPKPEFTGWPPDHPAPPAAALPAALPAAPAPKPAAPSPAKPEFTGWPPDPPALAAQPPSPKAAAAPVSAAPVPSAPGPAPVPSASGWALVGKILTVIVLAALLIGGFYGYKAYRTYAQFKEFASMVANPGAAAGLSMPAPSSMGALPSGAAVPGAAAVGSPGVLAPSAGTSLTPVLSGGAAPDATVATPQIRDMIGLAKQLQESDFIGKLNQRMASNAVVQNLRGDPEFDAAYKQAMRPGGNPMALMTLLNDPKTKARIRGSMSQEDLNKSGADLAQSPEMRQLMSLLGVQLPSLPAGAAQLAPIESKPVAPQLASPDGGKVDPSVMQAPGSAPKTPSPAPPDPR